MSLYSYSQRYLRLRPAVQVALALLAVFGLLSLFSNYRMFIPLHSRKFRCR